MNNRFLAATRAVLAVAIAVTGFITRHSQKITAAATYIHAASLDLAARMAERKVSKAWETYTSTLKMGDLIRQQAVADYDRHCAACDIADSVAAGVIAEKKNLGIV